MKDCVIIGKGPAGLSAALYVRRAGYTPRVIGRDSGALGQSHRIENYFGLAEPVVLDLGIIVLTFGLSIKITIGGIIGISIGVVIYRLL